MNAIHMYKNIYTLYICVYIVVSYKAKVFDNHIFMHLYNLKSPFLLMKSCLFYKNIGFTVQNHIFM